MNLRYLHLWSAALVLCGPALWGGSAPAFPNETLDYNIVWPSGINLGEAHWQAKNLGSATVPVWDLSLSFDARIPGFALSNSYHATTTGDSCMDTLNRQIQHGSRTNNETETIDHQANTVTRKTVSGGESTFSVPACVRDALTLVMLTRKELLNGSKVPAAQSVLLGAKYEVQMNYLGTQKVKSGDRTVDADRVGVSIRGPASNTRVEIAFARDAVRTPILVSVPLSMGTFKLELSR